MRFKIKHLILIVYSIAFFGKSYAAHIVGGDFSYRHISGDTYEIKMKMYRDCGGGGAPFESSLNVNIFDKETNMQVKSIQMPRRNTYRIQFNTGCTSPELRCVETGIFIGQFTMPKNLFNNTDGYYVVWERCCRNNIIKNIVNPGATPMAFYMELPSPYPANGNFSVNSSPEFLRDPLNYLCVFEPFKYDFKIYDPDGDELRISKVIPLAGGYTSTTQVGPESEPAPYDNTIWQPGYDLNTNLMDGNPDLIVDNDTASIFIVATQPGVYIISILCEEFRNGVKIGEVRRELQLEVLICPPRHRPEASSNLINNTIDVIAGQPACFNITGTDGDLLEMLRFRVDTAGLYHLLTSGEATLTPSDIQGTQSITTQFCWTPECPIDTTKGNFIDFIVYDNSCPFSQDDTVRVNFNFNNTPNNPPDILTSLPNATLNIRTGEQVCFFVQGTDADPGDQIAIVPIIDSIDIFSLGATMSPNAVGNVTVVSEVCWTPACGLHIDSSFVIRFEIYDDACLNAATDTLEITVNLLPINNEQPNLTTEGTLVGADNVLHATLDVNNCFYILGEDFDFEDDIDVSSAIVNYDFFANGASLVKVDDLNNLERYEFCWTPTCDNYYGEDELYIDFFVRDNKCENEKYDTLRITIKLEIPLNNVPAIIRPDSVLYNLNAGYGRIIPVSATDADAEDLMLLSAEPLFNSSVPLKIKMLQVSGTEQIQTELEVYPDCGLDANVDFPVRLLLLSNKFCNEQDTVEKIINFRVAPLLDFGDPMVPNVFSPNGDGINDVFKINMASRTICPGEFEVKIYDRWGQILFESEQPDFEWKAEGQHPGAYVYFLRVGESKYTGFIALVK